MKKILLSLFAAFSMLAVSAQFYYIPHEAANQNPGNINKDVEYPVGGGISAGWTSLFAGAQTNPFMVNGSIPFAFNFNGRSFTSYKITTSGVLTFSQVASIPTPYGSVDLSNSAIPDSSICVLGIQAKGAAGGTAEGYTNILTKTFGTAPHRQFWVTYCCYNEPNLTGTNNYFWLAIMLEETTNHIYLVNQRKSPATDVTKLSFGIKIDANNVYMVEGSPNLNSLAGTSPNSTDNSYYEFVPGTQPTYDIGIDNITTNSDVALTQGPINITGTLSNYGIATVQSFKLNYQVDNGAVQTMTVNNTILPFASYSFTHATAWSPTASGTVALKIWATDINTPPHADANPDNDGLKSIKVWDDFVPRKSLHENFTSSTCPPCKPGNIQLDAVLLAPEDLTKWTCIKYQYYFPGTGDPYFTLEANDRGAYYGGINSVPRLEVDGGYNGNPNSYTSDDFKVFQSKPAFLKIEASQVITGQKIDITAKFTPVIDYPAGNYKARFAVIERRTTKNIKTNGETEFFYVMKKMLPDVNGVNFSMPAKNASTTLTQSYTFPGTYRLTESATFIAGSAPTGSNYNGNDITVENSVEEFSDLSGVVFIQNETTKEIVQSEWTRPDYQGVKDATMEEIGATIYPNPATDGQFFVAMKNGKGATIKVFDITGKEVLTSSFGMTNENTVDCSKLSTGLYMVQITVDGKSAVKKVSITNK